MEHATGPQAEHRTYSHIPSTKPHRWALSSWARLYRRVARRWDLDKHVHNLCRPLTVEGEENLADLDNPALIIANHSSHFDAVLALSVLPERVRDRTAIAAAADRMYRERIKGMLHSLRYNAFPITRGGGSEALAYSRWLLRGNWSLLIFPEGKRSRTGELMPFHAGPAILALSEHLPVAPIYIEGASNILPPGTPKAQPAPVCVHIGKPFTFEQSVTIPDAVHAMEEAVRALMPDELWLGEPRGQPVLANHR